LDMLWISPIFHCSSRHPFWMPNIFWHFDFRVLVYNTSPADRCGKVIFRRPGPHFGLLDFGGVVVFQRDPAASAVGGLGHYRDHSPDAKVLSIFELQRTPRPRARPPAALSRDQPDSESRDRLAGRRTPGPGLRPRALILRRRITDSESRRDA